MSIRKRALIAGAAIAAVGMVAAGSVGLVSAAIDTSGFNASGGTSIVDKLVSKFNLNKDEVQAVFDEDRQAHKAEMQANQRERLAQAVTDGKLTQEQADYITKARAEIEALMGETRPDEEPDDVREQIKSKIDALRTWAEQNNVDRQYLGHGGRGFGGQLDDRSEDDSDDSGSDSSSDTDDSNEDSSSSS